MGGFLNHVTVSHDLSTNPSGTPTLACGVPRKGMSLVYHTSMVLELMDVRKILQFIPKCFPSPVCVKPLPNSKGVTADITCPLVVQPCGMPAGWCSRCNCRLQVSCLPGGDWDGRFAPAIRWSMIRGHRTRSSTNVPAGLPFVIRLVGHLDTLCILHFSRVVLRADRSGAKQEAQADSYVFKMVLFIFSYFKV